MFYDYRSKEAIEIENELSYLFEIIRRNFALKTNPNFSFSILKIVFFKLMSNSELNCEYNWDSFARNILIRLSSRDSLEEKMYFLEKFYSENYNMRFMSRPLFSELEIPLIVEVIDFLNQLNIEKITDPRELNILFYSFSQKIFKYVTPEMNTDETISDFISEIVEIKDEDRIIDPFVGTGGLLFKAIKKSEAHYVEIYTQDINKDILEMSTLLLNSLKNAKVYSNLGNSLGNNSFLSDEKRCSLFITHIPFLNSYYMRKYSTLMFSSNYLINSIEIIIEKLTSKGRAFLVIPYNFLFSKGEVEQYRKHLIEKDLIESIIEFNDQKNKNLVLLIINKNKKISRVGKLQLIKYEKKYFQNIVRDYFEFKKTSFSRIVSKEEIERRNYILSFSNYDPIFEEVFSMSNKGLTYRLKDIVDLHKSILYKNIEVAEGEIPLIKSRNLKRNVTEIYLDYEGVSLVKPTKSKLPLKEKSIIISLVGRDLKPTIFDPSNSSYQEVLLSNPCVALVLKNKDMDIFYLYDQLNTPFVLSQLEGYSRRSIVNRITYSDLMSIALIKPEFVKDLELNIYRNKVLSQLEENKLKYEEKNRNFEIDIIKAENAIVNMLIHNVGKHASKIGHNLSGLERILTEKKILGEIINKEEVKKYNNGRLVKSGFKPPLELITLGESIFQVKKYLSDIETTFKNTQKTVNLKLTKEDFEEINIYNLIKEIKEERQNSGATYEFIIEGKDISMNLHKETFKEMLNMLLDNAEVHAFCDKFNANNKVLFKIKRTKEKVVLKYENNGRKFPLTKEEFILAGKKRADSPGTGQGGAYIYRVALAHSGDFVIDYSKEGTSFIFEFNIGG